jgi:LysR family transcriptional activator of dmlA
MVGKRLREFQRILCASPAYLAARGEPASPADLAQHDCLVHAANEPRQWCFRRRDKMISQAIRARVETDNYAVLLELARQSLGVLRVSEGLVADDLRRAASCRSCPTSSASIRTANCRACGCSTPTGRCRTGHVCSSTS